MNPAKRTIVVGDLHGCHDEAVDLLDRLAVTESEESPRPVVIDAVTGDELVTPEIIDEGGGAPLILGNGFLTTRADGEEKSIVAVKQKVREIIAKEDKSHPLSDEEIVRILRERDGIKVARRTITKYRKALGIPASTMRRSY